MSIKTRIQALERKVLAKGEPPEEEVVKIMQIIVHNREEVQQLRAAGYLDPPPPCSRPTPRGRVQVVVAQTVDAKDWLAAQGTPMQDKGD
jgi:hypothetical protein